jgi:hypothetical protein
MFYTPKQIKSRWGILPGDREGLQSDEEERDRESWAANDSSHTEMYPPRVKNTAGKMVEQPDRYPGRNFKTTPMSDDEVWDAKREENDSFSPGFESDIRHEGVIAPVTLGKEYIQDGHHRIAAARDDQLIPALHTDNPKELGKSSPVLFDANSMYRYGAPNKDMADIGDGMFDPDNPQHKLVGGTTADVYGEDY